MRISDWSSDVCSSDLHRQEDEARTTASIHYAKGGLATMLAFSAKNRLPGRTLTAWLAEANWDIDRHHSLFGRIENVANDELFGEGDPPHEIGRANVRTPVINAHHECSLMLSKPNHYNIIFLYL